jgi:hypothetical protein
MWRNFKAWYKERNCNNRYNKHNLKCAKHILDMQNEYGKIEETMDIVISCAYDEVVFEKAVFSHQKVCEINIYGQQRT